MTTKKELTGNIARMEKELEEMKASLENMPDDKPQRDGVALDIASASCNILSSGNVGTFVGASDLTTRHLNQGGLFTTREAAEKEIQRRKLVQRMRVAANEAGGVDWGDNSLKYYPVYSEAENLYTIWPATYIRSSQLPHFPTEESLETFMDSLSKEEQKLLICGLD